MRMLLGALLALILTTGEDLAAQTRSTTETASASQVAALGSQVTALQSSVPARCASVPAADTLMGAVSAQNCYSAAGDSRPTVVQAAVVSTDASGNWSVSWTKAFSGSQPFLVVSPINPSDTQPYICNVGTSTTTSASGKCWKTSTMTLPGVALSLLNLVLNPTGYLGAGIQVRVVGRDNTQ